MSIHILQFFSVLNSGGAENRMMDVYSCIDPNVVVFDFAVVHEGKHFFDDFIKSRGSKKYVFPDPHKGIFKNYKAIKSFFKNNPQFQAVHAHVNWYNGVVLFAAKRAGVKIRIAHARDSALPNRTLKERVVSDIGKFLIHCAATQKIAISEGAAENVFGKNTVKTNNYLFVPNAIDQKKYKILSKTERESVRENLGINSDDLACVTIANLHKKKNHTFLLDIAKHIKERKKHFKLFLIGEGNLREAIEEKIKELKLEDTVVLLGIRKDVPEILNAFDAMIFPSLFEGLGGVVLESQLTGVPAIVSDRIPKTADVEINMVEYVSLEKSPEYWAQIVINKANNYSWDYESALKAFEQKGYIIEQTTRKYLNEYGLEKEIIEKAMI